MTRRLTGHGWPSTNTDFQAAAAAVLEKIQGQPIKSRVFIPELRCRESVATRT